MKSRLHKLTAKEKAQLKADPRIQELWRTYQERPLNIVEKLILKQLIAEAMAGALQYVKNNPFQN